MEASAPETEPEYEVYAIRYCHRPDNKRGNAFYIPDPCGDEPLPMDYFTWIAVSGSTVIGIDTGFGEGKALSRGREYIAPPTETMRSLGIEPAAVSDLVVSHLHWDHTGNISQFPNARIVLQEDEMAFWTGRWAGRGQFRTLHDPDDLAHLLQRNAAGGIRWVDGGVSLHPGVSVHKVAGHTPGMQVVRLNTRLGHVVIASDASHFYANIEGDQPYRILHTLPQVYEAFDVINGLADSPGLVVAGHDPDVLNRFPPASDALKGVVARIA